jgi:ribulose-5-phosphate 4-epimerase/fuculose-1-phosphate aldolase
MANLDALIDDLVTANRILAQEGVVDSFGHVSVRHPDKPDHYLLSRARAPDCIEPDDIMTFKLDGTPVNAGDRKPYMERHIHGAIYERRSDVHSVVHNHSPSVIPFGVTGKKLQPLLHMCANIGHETPVWDSRDKFGDTDLLVSSMDMGRDLAEALGDRRTALMRGHGAVVAAPELRICIHISIYLEVNAKLQMQAMSMGDVKYLSPGEIDAVIGRTGPYSLNRAWENWCRRAGRPFIPQEVT